jgi:hypothetical protein
MRARVRASGCDACEHEVDARMRVDDEHHVCNPRRPYLQTRETYSCFLHGAYDAALGLECPSCLRPTQAKEKP